jgi:hypothetical protein
MNEIGSDHRTGNPIKLRESKKGCEDGEDENVV